MGHWVAGISDDFYDVTPLVVALTDLNPGVISYNDTCKNTQYPLQSSPAIAIELSYIQGKEKIFPLTGFEAAATYIPSVNPPNIY